MLDVDPDCGCSTALTEKACKSFVVSTVCPLSSAADNMSDWIPIGFMKY